MIPIILHLDAGHDHNGNPRRCFVVINPETQTIIETIDEGYRGSAAWSRDYPEAHVCLQLATTPAQRRILLNSGQYRNANEGKAGA